MRHLIDMDPSEGNRYGNESKFKEALISVKPKVPELKKTDAAHRSSGRGRKREIGFYNARPPSTRVSAQYIRSR